MPFRPTDYLFPILGIMVALQCAMIILYIRSQDYVSALLGGLVVLLLLFVMIRMVRTRDRVS